MTIKLSNGKTYEINVVANGIGRGSNYLLIEMPNQYPLNALIADFSNVDSFEVKSQDEIGVKKVYEGYSVFAGIRIKHDEGVIQIRLERGVD